MCRAADLDALNHPRSSDEEAEFSLLTGSYSTVRSATHDVASISGADTAIALRNETTAIAELPSAQYLAGRTFGGLTRRLGETEVQTAVEGRCDLPFLRHE